MKISHDTDGIFYPLDLVSSTRYKGSTEEGGMRKNILNRNDNTRKDILNLNKNTPNNIINLSDKTRRQGWRNKIKDSVQISIPLHSDDVKSKNSIARDIEKDNHPKAAGRKYYLKAKP